MKQFAKTLCLFFVAVLMFGLTACNDNSNNNDNIHNIAFEDGETMQMQLKTKDGFQVMGISDRVHTATDMWEEFWRYELQFRDHYTEPFYQIAVYERFGDDDLRHLTIGAEYLGNRPDNIDLTVVDVPAAMWAVFTIQGPVHETRWDIYARVNDEWGATWFEEYGFARDENAPYLEIFPGSEYWELWIPVNVFAGQ